MKRFIWKKRFSLPEVIGLVSIAVICVSVVSYAVTVPNIFMADTVISAAEVNENFQALVDAVTTLESQVATIQANNALLLDQYITISSATINGLSGPHVILHDANLHIQNGSGATTIINGVGNLVVGYNEGPSTLNPGDRGGSHNLIVGPEHKYLSLGGFLAGFRNTVTTLYASVSGGYNNTASGDSSSVSGGYGNGATTRYASVSGGYENTAGGWFASVSGGYQNTASNWYSSVSGGYYNTASGFCSSVSGGLSRSAVGLYDWAAGSLWEDQ